MVAERVSNAPDRHPAVPRSPQFEIGQIVHHRRYDYRGVIIGCDDHCRAGDAWYDYQTAGKPHKPTRQQPWYHVLVDGATHQTYVAHENLEPGDGSTPIAHPMVEEVFAAFLDGRYYREHLN